MRFFFSIRKNEHNCYALKLQERVSKDQGRKEEGQVRWLDRFTGVVQNPKEEFDP